MKEEIAYGVIKGDTVHGVVIVEVILIRVVVSVPADDVERRVVLGELEQLSQKL
jgi:hypothetical protein